MYEYFAKYDGLRDADTLWLMIDAGFYITIRRRPYRLMRVNAWEKKDLTPDANGSPRGYAALEAVDALCIQARAIRVQTFRNKVASGDPELTFDRWLAEVWLDDVNLSDWIVANNHGVYKAY